MIARFFRSDAMSEKLGELDELSIESAEFFQLTYDDLRDMEGETIARFDHEIDAWLCLKNGALYSDVVIHTQ